MEASLRVLLLSQFYPPIVGGEERHVRNLAAALAQRGHQVSVATLWYPGAVSDDLDGAVRVHRIRGALQRLPGLFAERERRHAPPFPDPELVAGLRRVLREEKPDIVHAHNWLLASFLPLQPWHNAGLVVTLHDYGLVCAKKNLMHQGEVCNGPALRKCLSCAAAHYGTFKAAATVLGNFTSGTLARRAVDRFIAVSHAVARHSGLVDGATAFEVIPNFVPDDIDCIGAATDRCLEQLPQEPYILFVGDVMHLKGADILLNAYASLTGPPPLVLIGRRCPDTPSKFPPNVHLLGPWPHSAIMHAWRRCLFGVVPSVGPEACATVVMEAMASGKPVVATQIGGMPDLVEPDETGLLVPAGDTAALAHALRRLLADPQLVARLAAGGLVRVERLKAGCVVARIEAVYRDVLRGRAVRLAVRRGNGRSRAGARRPTCGQ